MVCAPAIWVGLPILGIDELAMVEVRAGLIAAVLFVLSVVGLVRRRARRKAARSLESSLLDSAAGDGEVLAERMQDALARLKQSGGTTALYDLPWYVLIGPPGAGKTTALVHSGLEFPGSDPESVTGFGGTRNCDFWFARDAVLIDTAGRYTTHDSDAQADRASWSAFLNQLKGARPDQPINGVILALSCSDLITAGEHALKAHAETIRARLSEVHDALRVDVPVYVIFTKADMIAGFRQYFGAFDEARRRTVWGVTFQTRSRREETHQLASQHFKQLVVRLSDEVTDRMVEELDSATRISIFGFPQQMAMLEQTVTTFLTRVFEGQKQTHAILRGFYFTSGTQEGSPIDQVLGTIAAGRGAGGLQPAFMSGRGRSYFLHDLLKKVIFAERDWVGYDRRRMLRRSIVRGFAKLVIAVGCIGAMGAFGYSFWNNASLVRDADAQTRAYAAEADRLLNQRYVDNAATRPILPALAAVRVIPAGYGNPRPQEGMQQLGLSRREMLRGAAVEAYSDALERLLRPRMMLLAERRLANALRDGDGPEAYRALKVYILLAKEQDGRDDDLAVQTYFAESWSEEYATPGSDADYRAVNSHLAAMLVLDDRVSPPIKPNKALVDRAREELLGLPLADRVYSAIRSDSGVLPPWRLVDGMGPFGAQLRTRDGRPPETLMVPGLYSYEGYWTTFQEALAAAPVQVSTDAWVLGPGSVPPGDLVGLDEALHALYVEDFATQWDRTLDRVAGTSARDAVVALTESVVSQTYLSRALDPGADGGPSNTLKNIKNFWPDVTESQLRRRAEAVQTGLVRWHSLLRGPIGGRPVDTLAEELAALAGDPGRWGRVAARADLLPPALGRIAGQVGIVGAEAALARDVTAFCQQQIMTHYPFAPVGSAPLPLEDFAGFFGYGGRMDRFWRSYAAGQELLPLSPGVRDDFAAIEALRQSLFTDGSLVPDIGLTLTLGALSPGVTSVSVDLGNGPVELRPGGEGITVRWPSGVNGIALTVNEGQDDAVSGRVPGGAWSVISFLRGAQDMRVAGKRVDVVQQVADFTLRFGLEAEAGLEMPFASSVWRDFVCPVRLE